ncbi:MAG: Ig-like domain-containing protein [Thermostichus sp. HHBFW_bins_43]
MSLVNDMNRIPASSASWPERWLPQPLDRWVAGISLCSLVIGGILFLLGNHTAPYVRDFNWQQQRVGSRDLQMVLTFNRPMDAESIAANLEIQPPLPGRMRKLGRRFFWTLAEPAPYGQTYRVQLQAAQDERGQAMSRPFQGEFRTPDRQLLGVSSQAGQAGRLFLFNVETGSTTLLTPAGLKVTQMQPSADGQFVYYFATQAGIQAQDLYRLDLEDQTSQLLLDHRGYQNLRVQVSPTGELVVAERMPLERDPSGLVQTELWIQKERQEPFRPLTLDTAVGGDFLISPDESSLLISQGRGVGIVPLHPRASAESFLAQFGQTLAIRPDGAFGALLRFNPDYTRSLWIVSNTGNSQEILVAEGSIGVGAFSSVAPVFYSLVSQIDPETYTESPRLLAINWEEGSQTEVVGAEYPIGLDFSLAPDGRALAYTLLEPFQGLPDPAAPLSRSGQAIASSQVWLVELEQGQPIPGSRRQLPLASSMLAWIP